MSAETAASAVHLLTVAAVVWSVICRARLMDHNTRWRVRLQHGLLQAGALFSLAPMPQLWQLPVLSIGVTAFLLLEARHAGHAVPVEEPGDE